MRSLHLEFEWILIFGEESLVLIFARFKWTFFSYCVDDCYNLWGGEINAEIYFDTRKMSST